MFLNAKQLNPSRNLNMGVPFWILGSEMCVFRQEFYVQVSKNASFDESIVFQACFESSKNDEMSSFDESFAFQPCFAKLKN